MRPSKLTQEGTSNLSLLVRDLWYRVLKEEDLNTIRKANIALLENKLLDELYKNRAHQDQIDNLLCKKVEAIVSTVKLNSSSPTWYVLMDGHTEDGSGRPHFVGRTIDKEVAVKHLIHCRTSAYNVGNVIVYTETGQKQVRNAQDLPA
jgi:hypothetical protein